MFSCLLLKWSILFVNSCQIITPTCFSLNFNTLIVRKELRKSERIKKMGVSHLITAKTITSLEPKLSREVGGARPLQLCCLTYFALSYDVAVIQWLTSCHKNRMTTRYITLGYWLLHIKVRLPVLLCVVKTVEGDFRFCWTTTPNVGQTHKENPNLVRILCMVCTLNDIYKQYNKLHEH